jgi:hypothetical protein
MVEQMSPSPARYDPPGNPHGALGLSTTSMALGITGLVVSLSIPVSIAAVITGHLARKREPAGRNRWVAGITCGYIGVVLSLLELVAVVYLFGIGGDLLQSLRIDG